jgi:predicted alpha/beta superfamily hydrolase
MWASSVTPTLAHFSKFDYHCIIKGLLMEKWNKYIAETMYKGFVRLFLCCIVWAFLVGRMYAAVELVINNLPANTPAQAEIYVAGSFNNWNPGDPAYRMELDSSFRYRIRFETAPGTLQFKFTRGAWSSVEGNANGGFRPNRTLSYAGGDTTIQITILSWEDLGGPGSSTASPQVSVLTDSFYMPQFGRYRRIWLYLPEGYASSQDSFPVLYLQDGQNLFDSRTAFAGEWRIDESMDSLIKKGHPPIIVVGIDNGGGNRISEYTPWPHPVHGGGAGAVYVNFLAETLKPYIDQHYRTKRDAANTGVGGSSLGGLISIYAGLQRPDVFGRIAAFSSSFWFSDSVYRLETYDVSKPDNRPLLYMIAGELEGSNQTQNMLRYRDSLITFGWSSDASVAIAHTDGRHQEWYWAREFPEAYLWLFDRQTNNLVTEIQKTVQFALDTSAEYFVVRSLINDKQYRAELIDSGGALKAVYSFSDQLPIRRDALTPGLFVLRVYEGPKLIWTRKLLSP